MPRVGLTQGQQAGGVARVKAPPEAAPGALPGLSVWEPLHVGQDGSMF